MARIKVSISTSSIEQNLWRSLLLRLLDRSPQEDMLGGARVNERVARFKGALGLVKGHKGAVVASIVPTALLTAMARLAKSSKSLMLVCLLGTVGVIRLLELPPWRIQGCSSTWLASSLASESLTRRRRMRSLAWVEMADQCWSGKTRRPSLMLEKRSSWQSVQDSPRSQPQSEPQLPEKGA